MNMRYLCLCLQVLYQCLVVFCEQIFYLLVKFTYRYFIVLMCCAWHYFLYSFWDSFLLVYRNKTDCWILILYPATLLNSFISFNSFFGGVFRVFFSFFKKILFIYIFRQRERNINVWLPVMRLLLGSCPATQACVLTGNRTGDTLVRRLVLIPLSHTSQGHRVFYTPDHVICKQRLFIFPFWFGCHSFLFLVWLFCLGLPVLFQRKWWKWAPFLIMILEEKTFNFHYWLLLVGLSCMAFTMLRYISFILSFLGVFIKKYFVKCFFCIYGGNHVIFLSFF